MTSSHEVQIRLELNYFVPKHITFGICTSLLEAYWTKQRDNIDYIQPDHFAEEPNKHKQTQDS